MSITATGAVLAVCRLRGFYDLCSNSPSLLRLGRVSRKALLLFFTIVSPAFSQTSLEPVRIDAVTYQRVVEENLDLRKEQARIEAEMSALRRKNASLLIDIQDLERKRDQLTALVAQLKTPDELAAQMARLNAEKLVLVREIERLRESLSDPVASSPATNPIPITVFTPAPGSDLFRRMERENADLRQEMAKVRAAGMNETVAKDIALKSEMVLKTEVSRLDAQYKTLAGELEAYRRREASLKKAVEAQSKKAFEAEKAMKAARQIQDQKEEEAEVASKKAAKAEEALKKLKETSFVLPQGRQSANPLPQSDKLTMISSLLYAGQQSLEAKRYKEAEKHYLNAYKLEPENAMISYNLGILYGEYLKDYSRAEKFYRKYLVLAPNAADSAQVRSWLVDLTARSKW